MNNRLKGEQGEKIAVKFLKKAKYKVLAVNYVTRIGEIDIIAAHKGTLIFIEVKSRANVKFGTPSEAVTSKKQRTIINVSQLYYLENKLHDIPIRYDVIEINDTEVNHIINAFGG